MFTNARQQTFHLQEEEGEIKDKGRLSRQQTLLLRRDVAVSAPLSIVRAVHAHRRSPRDAVPRDAERGLTCITSLNKMGDKAEAENLTAPVPAAVISAAAPPPAAVVAGIGTSAHAADGVPSTAEKQQNHADTADSSTASRITASPAAPAAPSAKLTAAEPPAPAPAKLAAPAPVPAAPATQAASNVSSAATASAATVSALSPVAPAVVGAAGEVAVLRVQDGNKQSQHQPKILDKLYTCKWKNGTLQTARVVEKRLDKNGKWEYYMHYEDFDRRLDEWVGADRLGDEVIKHRSVGEVASAESNQKMTRTQKRRFDEIHTVMPADVDPSTAALEHEREQATKVKNIQTVELGKFEMETWYYSPYPEEFSKCAKIFLCEFCLKYFRKPKTLERHKGKCEWRHPPGDEVYRHDNVSMFEVDGKKAKIYCQVRSVRTHVCTRAREHTSK